MRLAVAITLWATSVLLGIIGTLMSLRFYRRLRLNHPALFDALGGPSFRRLSLDFGPGGWERRRIFGTWVKQRRFQEIGDPVAALLGARIKMLSRLSLMMFFAALLVLIVAK